MITHDTLRTEAVQPSAYPLLRSGFSSLAPKIAAWIATAADYYEAAATYEQLSRLSDAELNRRELSRATLARNICRACDRTSNV